MKINPSVRNWVYHENECEPKRVHLYGRMGQSKLEDTHHTEMETLLLPNP